MKEDEVIKSQSVLGLHGPKGEAEPAGWERPGRPRRYDPAVTRAAAEDLAVDVAEWAEETVDEGLIVALAGALGRETDGYDLARELDRSLGYRPDARLVEILDNNGLYEAERQAVARWVAETGAVAELPDGTMVKWPRGTGEITGRNAEEATYTVWNEASRAKKQPRCGFVVPAEDCIALGADASGEDGTAERSALPRDDQTPSPNPIRKEQKI